MNPEFEEYQYLNTRKVIVNPQFSNAKSEVMGLYETYMRGWARNSAIEGKAMYSQHPNCDSEEVQHCKTSDLKQRILRNQIPYDKYRVCSTGSHFLK